ncbi:hypothetical protein BH09MYX1_BH09MYX1_09510 [soil metagenome]
MSAHTLIANFEFQLLLPLYEEVRSSPRMAAKERTFQIERELHTDDPITNGAFAAVHSKRRSIADLASTAEAAQAGEWIGSTLVLVEPAEKRASYTHPQAGRFYLSALYRLPGDGRVFASPWVVYWMRFNDALHAFAHRYVGAIAEHPIETLTRKDLVNHALGAISGFDIYAYAAERPF